MAERQQSATGPEPFSKDDFESIYWALVDMLTSGIAIEEVRRARLKALVSRLSEHVRHLEIAGRTSSGMRKKVDIAERKEMVRKKLLARRQADEIGTWAVYAEDIEENAARAILISIVEGSYAEAVERALVEPGFITEGMGGQIDPLGMAADSVG